MMGKRTVRSLGTSGNVTNFSAALPAGLRRSAVPLTIICGPPGSGKTSYVRRYAAENDVVIDLDKILLSIDSGYRPWQGRREGLLEEGLRRRNDMLRQLSAAKGCRAWFIVGAPTRRERSWWQGCLGGNVVLLDPGPDECKRRVTARGTPAAREGVDRWYERAARDRSAHSRGYGVRWRKVRKQYLNHNPLCKMCHEAGRIAAASVVDHVVPHKGDQVLFWDVNNWQGLCYRCHNQAKKREEIRGYSLAVGEDGWPLDPNHPANLKKVSSL